MSNREVFDKRKNIEVIGKQVFFVFFFVGHWRRIRAFSVEKLQVGSNFQFRYKVGLLKIRPKVAVLGDVSEQLK